MNRYMVTQINSELCECFKQNTALLLSHIKVVMFEVFLSHTFCFINRRMGQNELNQYVTFYFGYAGIISLYDSNLSPYNNPQNCDRKVNCCLV